MDKRIAEQKDMPALLEIYNHEVLHGVSTFDLNIKTIEERMEWFKAHNIGNHPLIVADLDGAVAGYASLSSYRDKEAYAATVELSVYVHPDYRRRGVARYLMGEILKEARQRDDIHTVISVITEGNEASVKLHEAFGFRCCGTMNEVGEKFGRKLGIVNYQLMVG
jgi:Sortase and related acyltransferases